MILAACFQITSIWINRFLEVLSTDKTLRMEVNLRLKQLLIKG